MANIPSKYTPAIGREILPVSEPNKSLADMKAEVVMALSHLDALYRQNIHAYAEKLHDYTRKIENAQNHLAQYYKEKEPYDNRLSMTQKEIDHLLLLLERLTQEWNQKSAVICELENELSQLNHSSKERKDILKGRNETIIKLESEIEDIELLVLEQELQKQNVLLEIEPLEREINALERSIKELESEKRYIEALHLHQISPSVQSSKKITN